MQRLALATACVLAAASFTALPAVAQNKGQAPAAAKSPGLGDLDCRTLLRLGGEERSYTLLYYHGFVSGRLNQMDLPVETMSAATDKIIDHCIDKPNDKVLSVFEQVRKQR